LVVVAVICDIAMSSFNPNPLFYAELIGPIVTVIYILTKAPQPPTGEG
jgi:hypothetical protein